MKPALVFVYGTLKRGHRNNYILATSRFVGEGVTVAKCRLFDSGFPVLRKGSEHYKEQNAPVQGEVFLVDSEVVMYKLDQLESEGRMCHRRTKMIRLDNGRTVRANTYVGDTKFWRSRRVRLYDLQGPQYSWPRWEHRGFAEL